MSHPSKSSGRSTSASTSGSDELVVRKSVLPGSNTSTRLHSRDTGRRNAPVPPSDFTRMHTGEHYAVTHREGMESSGERPASRHRAIIINEEVDISDDVPFDSPVTFHSELHHSPRTPTRHSIARIPRHDDGHTKVYGEETAGVHSMATRTSPRRSGRLPAQDRQEPSERNDVPKNEPQEKPPSPGRPSGPLSSTHRERHVLNSRRNASAKIHQTPHKMYTSGDLPFTPPLPYQYYPNYKGCARYQGFHNQKEPQQFFDCKFYPFTEPGVDPVFAVVGGTKTIIMRPSQTEGELFDVLLWLEESAEELPASAIPYRLKSDEIHGESRQVASNVVAASAEPTTSSVPTHSSASKINLNSCAWLRGPIDGRPYLAVSGKPSSIKVFDVTKKRLERILVGHGKEVNDLTVSPRDPSILASASGDNTARIWSIDPKYQKQPCLAIYAGEGHRQGILTLAFHGNGRFLLTGGFDNAICLWAIPPLPDDNSGTDKPTMIHYPHFKTTAVHMSFVDCITFHGDLIISKSSQENQIVLWRIEGFDSRESPPKAPVDSQGATSSAFGGKFQRLAQFETDDMDSFYIRFSLFNFPDQRPILAVGNERSKIYFWDLQALIDYNNPQMAVDGEAEGTNMGTLQGARAARRKGRGSHRGGDARQESVHSEHSNPKSNSTRGFGSAYRSLGVIGVNKQKMEGRYKLTNPFATLQAHKISTVQKVSFACRQVAWSVGGEYMVVVGDQGMIALFSREMSWPDKTEQ